MEETLSVPDEDAGQRLDRFVSAKLPTLSRTLTQELIAEGLVRVRGDARKANYRVKSGDMITVDIPEGRPTAARAEQVPLEVLFEDETLLVVNKAAGMVVHPAAGHSSGTLVNALLGHSAGLVIGNTERPGLVHRLDRDTSGLIVVAKQEAALKNLQRQFGLRTVYKAYLALVNGQVASLEGRIEAPLARDPHDRKRFAVVASARARQAVTIFRVVERLRDFTLLKVEPRTGRTHQIRVHLAFIGHPVVADRVYGHKRGNDLGLSRQFLHAWRLGFLHPDNEKPMEFTAPLPDDLSAALTHAGGDPGPWK